MIAGFHITADSDPYGIAAASRCWDHGHLPTAIALPTTDRGPRQTDADSMIVGTRK
jgi:hypothetical protein